MYEAPEYPVYLISQHPERRRGIDGWSLKWQTWCREDLSKSETLAKFLRRMADDLEED